MDGNFRAYASPAILLYISGDYNGLIASPTPTSPASEGEAVQGCVIFVSLVQLSRILQAPGLNATHRNIFCSTELIPPTHGRIDIPFRPTQNGELRTPRPQVTALSTFQPTTLYFSVLNSHSQYTSHLDIQSTETAGSSAPSLAPRKFSGCSSWDWIRMLICCQPFLTT